MLFGLVTLLALLGAAPFRAEASVGSVVSGSVQTDRGYAIPLPAGRWRVTHIAEPHKDHALRVWVLRSEEAAPLVPYLMVRWPGAEFSSNDFCIQDASGVAFRVERMGSQPNQFVQRCVRTFTSGLPYGSSNPWWRGLDKGFLQEDGALRSESMALLELTVYRWKGAYARVEAFVRTGLRGTPASQLRDEWRAGRQQPWHASIHAWSEQYIRQMEELALNGKPAMVARLDAPAGAAAGSPAVAATAATGGSPARPLTREQIDERIRQMADVGAGRSPVPPPASSVSTPPAPAPAMSRDQVDDRIRQMAEAGRSSSPAPAPTFAAAVPSAPPQAATQTQGQPPVQSPAQPPQGPAVSAQELSRLAAEVARLREELKARPPEQGPATRPASPAQVAPTGARRLALVIGNDGYRSVPRLLNAQTDARAMGDLLTRLGYRVRVRTDLSERAMKDELRAFKAEVQGGDEVLFFFAGHGVQLSGANYLLPTDIRGDSEDQVRDDALPLQKVLDDLQERKARFALAIVDACRDNPFKGVAGRSIGTRGLAPTTAATGQMVMFSAGAGQQALDRLNDRDRDPNGLFTRVLLKELEKPGVSVDRVLRTVRSQVVEMARAVGHEQVPALYDQTVGEFYFRH